MASVKSVAITNLDAVPAVNAGGGNLSPMMVWHDTYEASSLGSGSDITIARLPAGATIHDVIIKADALGGSSTLTVGDSGDADRYLAAVGTWNAAGQCQSMLAGSTAANTAVVRPWDIGDYFRRGIVEYLKSKDEPSDVWKGRR